MEPKLLPAVGDGGRVEHREPDPGLGTHSAEGDRPDGGQLGQIEYDSALQRHGLTVIAGTAPRTVKGTRWR